MMDPANSKKQKTFKRMNPAASALSRETLDEFLLAQQTLLTLIEKAKLVNVNSGKVRVEFLQLLTMNIGESLRFIVVHEQRHMLQAMKVLQNQTRQEPSILVL
jgi:hypothetical protein